jgi:hypothetical protein
VTDPNGRIRRKDVQGPIPATALEFVKYFRESTRGRANMEDITAYRAQFADSKGPRASQFVESTRTERAQHTRKASPYTISLPMQARAVMVRRLQIIKGSATELIIQVASFTIQGVITGTGWHTTPCFLAQGAHVLYSVLKAPGGHVCVLLSRRCAFLVRVSIASGITIRLTPSSAPCCLLLCRRWQRSQHSSANGPSLNGTRSRPCTTRLSKLWL